MAQTGERAGGARESVHPKEVNVKKEVLVKIAVSVLVVWALAAILVFVMF
jgi:hypothetical protein